MLPDGTGYLERSDLPSLADDRTYQLWGIDGDTVVSLGVLGPSVEPSAFKFVGNPESLAITDEVAGGVGQSKHQPVVAGRAVELDDVELRVLTPLVEVVAEDQG